MFTFIQLKHVLSPALLALVICSTVAVAQPQFLDIDMEQLQEEQSDAMIDSSRTADSQIAPPISPIEAANLVRRQIGGQVMSVTTQQNDTTVIYGVKVLNSGRMKVINVDGQTGQLLNN